jgi:hypothetical protein
MADAAITIRGTEHRQAAAAPAPLPWPAAALAIGALSAGLWLGIFWVAAELF